MASFVLGGSAAANRPGSGSSSSGKSVDTDHLDQIQMKMNGSSNSHAPLQQHSSLPPTSHELYHHPLHPQPKQPSPAPPRPKLKRHYKKDSRFVLDLYTLTFDENETVDEIEPCKTAAGGPGGGGAPVGGEGEFLSLAPSTISIGTLDSSQPGSGPMSLGSNYSVTAATNTQESTIGG